MKKVLFVLMTLLTFCSAQAQTNYAINILTTTNGTVDVDKYVAAIGETVTITITLDEGYIVDKVTVTAGYEPGEDDVPDEADAPSRRAPRKTAAWVSQGEIEVKRVNATTYTFTLPETLPGPLTTDYTANTEFNVTATFKEGLILANDADNEELINNWIAENGFDEEVDVILKDRTLKGNGIWNTICLPFSLILDQTIFADAEVKKLNSSVYDENKHTLELTFEDSGENTDCGYPYIVRWPEGTADIVDPVFEKVIIFNECSSTSQGCVEFKGTFKPVVFDDEDRTVLFLGTDNKLYYPDGVEPTYINSQHGYFKLADGYEMKSSSSGESDGVKFRIHIEEDDTPTSIEEILNNSENIGGEWYDLTGRKVNGKPMKGIYINNGKKIVIK